MSAGAGSLSILQHAQQRGVAVPVQHIFPDLHLHVVDRREVRVHFPVLRSDLVVMQEGEVEAFGHWFVHTRRLL